MAVSFFDEFKLDALNCEVEAVPCLAQRSSSNEHGGGSFFVFVFAVLGLPEGGKQGRKQQLGRIGRKEGRREGGKEGRKEVRREGRKEGRNRTFVHSCAGNTGRTW